jgi:hypothetical protein
MKGLACDDSADLLALSTSISRSVHLKDVHIPQIVKNITYFIILSVWILCRFNAA